jgi:hypothetical protein
MNFDNPSVSICYSPKLDIYVSVSKDTTGQNDVRYSLDNKTWTPAIISKYDDYNAVYWSATFNLFVITGLNRYSEKIEATSSDGIRWVIVSLDAKPFIQTIILEEVKEVKEMKNTIEELKNNVADLKEIITQLLYAPGMPGYIQAREDFEKLTIKK